MTVHWDGINPELKQRVDGMVAESGGLFYVASAVRTHAEQQALYDGHARDPEHFSPANRPGTSHHEVLPPTNMGEAVDVDTDPKNAKLHDQLCAKWGLHKPYPGERWHCELDPHRGPVPGTSTPSQEDDVPQPFSCLIPSGRGWWQIHPDGSVDARSFDGKPIAFHGSIHDPGLEREAHVPGRVFTNIQPAGPSDEDGYILFSSDGGAFHLRKP